MRPIFRATLFVLALASTGMGQAATYNFTFPSENSTIVGSVGSITPTQVGYFWSVSRGDKVSESFASSGLFGATTLDLDLNVTDNVLSDGASVDWDVLVNGVDIGDWTLSSASSTGLTHLSYTFDSIQGEFSSLALVVKNEVPAGSGSISLGINTIGRVTNAVPEPEAYALVFAGLGVVGFAGWHRSKRQIAAAAS